MDNKKLVEIDAAIPLLAFISIHYEGSQVRFAKAQGVAKQQVSQWIRSGYIVVDGIMFSARRAIK